MQEHQPTPFWLNGSKKKYIFKNDRQYIDMVE